jgi:ABC-type antimicrobial peptide transport system permease subunit
MSVLCRWRARLRTVLFRDALDRDLDRELSEWVDELTERYEAGGASPPEARRRALIETGGVEQVKQQVRDGRIGAGLDSLLLDVRYGWRSLRKAQGLTAVIVITLALGIGANTAIFSVVRAMLLKPLPFRDADRLVFVWLDMTEIGYPRGPMSGPDLQNLRERSRTCVEFGGIWATGTVALTGQGDPEQLRAAFVTSNFFQVLGAESAVGRTFRAEDSVPGAPPTILLGWDLFVRRFGGDPSIVGRQIVVNDQPTTVIGVMPAAFRLLLPPDSSVPDRLQVWQPFWPDFDRGPRGNLFLRVIGRMRPGVTVAEARADIASIARRITREFGTARAFTTVALQADDVREIRGPLLALFAGVGILLMIACVNVAGLLIARAVSRAREIALRLALGASRRRLLRQSLVEGLLLTPLGAAAGVVAGYAGLRVLLALTPESLSRIESARIDTTVLVFTLAISVVWGLLFSLAPATEILPPSRLVPWGRRRFGEPGSGLSLHPSTGGLPRRSSLSSRASSAGLPRRGSLSFHASGGGYQARAALIVLQIALSTVLLVNAGLLARAFVEVQRIDPGFRTDRHLTFRVAIPDSRYQTTDSVLTAASELQRRLSALSGVTGVGAISHLPYDDLPNWYLTYSLEATPSLTAAAKADARAISTGLFETLGVQLVEGRFFTDDESPKNPVVIVDDMLARRLWPGRSAVGQQFLLGQASPDQRVSVVGIVRHLRLRSLVEDLTPQVFIPYRLWQRSPMAYIVRTNRDPSSLAAEARAAVAALDPRLPIYDVRPMTTYVEAARSIRRFTMLLAAIFAVSALALTSVGVYGVLAYAVANRRHEFGVRTALGAEAARVRRDVLREGLRFAVIGCIGGLAGSVVAGRFLQSQLYAVHPRDPISYGLGIGLILCAAVVACWIPAHRATAISPMDALRTE